jgi:hypothetical protein
MDREDEDLAHALTNVPEELSQVRRATCEERRPILHLRFRGRSPISMTRSRHLERKPGLVGSCFLSPTSFTAR